MVPANTSTVARRMDEMRAIGMELRQYLHLFTTGEQDMDGLGLSVSGGKHTHAAVFGGSNATLFIVNAADKPASVTVHGRSRHFKVAMAPWDVHIGGLSGKR